jgi:hypothetical protein
MKNQFLKSFAIAGVCLTLMATLVCPPRASAQQFSAWSAAVNLGPVVNSAGNEERPAISRDGLSLYFSSTKPGGFGGPDLYVSQRLSLEDPWGPPVNLGPNINTSGGESAPNLPPDGHYLFFLSPCACGGNSDRLFAHRKDRRDDFGWEPAINLDLFGREPGAPLPCIVNSTVVDGGPDYFQDETTGVVTMYFNSNRRGGIGDFDIYTTTLGPAGTFGAPLLDLNLNSPFRDTRTAIRRRDGLEFFLTSERPPGTIGDANIWVSTRPDTASPWSTPVLLAQAPLQPGELPINIIGDQDPGPGVLLVFDGSPALSWDGTELYFHSNRPGGSGGLDLYVAKRTKITGQQ